MLNINTKIIQLRLFSNVLSNYLYILMVLSLLYTNSSFSHGFVVNSRADFCSSLSGLNSDCGVVSGLRQYILGVGRFPVSGPLDGQLASAGIPDFAELDVQNENRWHKQNISTGPIEFLWGTPISHPTTEFRYFITKTSWNPNITLRRSSFDLTPFCTVTVNLDEIPSSTRHNCNIPLSHTGYHVIYATWDTTNENLGFYQVLDVNISEQIDLIFHSDFE